MIPTFDAKFDLEKISRFIDLIPPTYSVMNNMVRRKVHWPTRIEAMTAREIREGKKAGKGHGLYIPGEARIKINASMSALGIYLNFIHENLHHALPEFPDDEINEVLVPWIYEEVTGKPIPKKEGRAAGVM